MSIIVYQDVATPIIPAGDLAGPVRDALGASLSSMRYLTPDFAGLYQDAAGTNPVTAVGQPVGLMLDRRFGLARGEDESGVSSFLKSEDGTYFETLVSAAGNYGKTYEVTLSVTSASTAASQVQATGTGSSGIVFISSAGQYRGVFKMADSGPGVIRIGGSTTSRIAATNIVVREVPGNHASQATTTARPTLSSGPLRIDYDGVDDYLRTVFPALGSDVTIARSIPSVGAQILTGQAIAAGNWDDNVDSCATLVIDRALTGPETALVTAFLNQQAGV